MLLIFVKYPEPGKVKTRLAKDIGSANAAALYRKMAENIICNLSKLTDYTKIIFFHPPERKNDIMRWLQYGGLYFIAQEGHSLGERMSHAFSHAFSQGAKKAVIVGTDCPELKRQTIIRAFEKLDDAEVVIGPSYDGGYYLLGLRRFIPGIFQHIDWSTDQVLDQTMKKLRLSGILSERLEMLRDVDTIEDLTNSKWLLNNR